MNSINLKYYSKIMNIVVMEYKENSPWEQCQLFSDWCILIANQLVHLHASKHILMPYTIYNCIPMEYGKKYKCLPMGLKIV
jgi:hypothetical protein